MRSRVEVATGAQSFLSHVVAVAAIMTFLAVLLTSCSGGGSASTQPSADQAEVAAIAGAATDYFATGIGEGTWEVASQRSTGRLKAAADWLVTQGISASEDRRGTFEIHSMAVTSVDGSTASLSLDATQTGANYTTTYAGPVSMVRTTDGWKVEDYLRDGRDAASAIFPNAHGKASNAGVTVEVVGAQLEAGHVDVWVEITNATPATLSWDRPIVIADAAGQQRGRGALFVSSEDTGEPFEMLPRLSAFGDFLIDSVTLPLTTSTFNLLVGATDRSTRTAIDVRVPVTLG